MWGAILGRYVRQNEPTLPSWRLSCYRYGMICHRSSLIRQSCHFERHFDSVLLQLADTWNNQFKYRDGKWHSLLKRLKCLRKSYAKFDSLLSNYWIFRIRLVGSVALLVARTNDRKVAGSRPTKVVCITVLTSNRIGVNCPLWPAATPSSEL